MNYNDKDINGNVWCKGWVDAYNNMTALIERTYDVELQETYKDQRHLLYVTCMNIAMEGIDNE